MAAILALAFIAVPIAEIWLIIQVGQTIGAWQTVVALVAISVLGAWLVRREGRRTWAALTTAVQLGRLPARELSDAGLVLVGGTLLLTPGFLTDLVGLVFLLPPTRPVARRLLLWVVGRRIARASIRYGPGQPYVHDSPGDVIHGEVIEEDRNGPRP